MIKLAVVAGFPPDKEGEANYSSQVYMALAKKFADTITINVYAHQNDNAPQQADLLSNLRVTRVTGGKSRSQRTKSVFRLYKMLKQDRPDVIHFQGTHTALYGGLFGEPVTLLYYLLRKAGIPTILTLHSTWMPEEVTQLWKDKKMPSVIAGLLSWYNRQNLRMIARHLSTFRILTAGDTSPVMNEYVKAYNLKPRELVHEAHACVNHFVDAVAVSRAKQSLNLDNKRIVLATGFVRRDKGYHLLLEVVDQLIEQYDDVHFIIAGNPSGASGQKYAEELTAQREALKHKKNVTLKFEYITDEELEKYLTAADIIAIPYARVIGASGPVHHALGKGKAVVATNMGHNKGLEGTVKLFDANNVSSLLQGFEELLTNTDDLEKFKKAAVRYAVNHTWEKLATDYFNNYQRLIQRSPVS